MRILELACHRCDGTLTAVDARGRNSRLGPFHLPAASTWQCNDWSTSHRLMRAYGAMEPALQVVASRRSPVAWRTGPMRDERVIHRRDDDVTSNSNEKTDANATRDSTFWPFD